LAGYGCGEAADGESGMSDDRSRPLPAAGAAAPGDAALGLDDSVPAPIGHLEAAGFFDQIGALERTLKRIAGDLKLLGDATVRGRGDTESLAAHILALEAAVGALMRTMPLDAETLRADRQAALRRRTGGSA